MNYGLWTVYNLLPTDADGIVSPDILIIVHDTKGEFIHLKEFIQQLHIIRFKIGSAISRFWAYTDVLWSSAQTKHSYMVPRAALRKMTSQNYHMGSKINSAGPQRTLVRPPRSLDALIRVNNSHFPPYQKYSEKDELQPRNRL